MRILWWRVLKPRTFRQAAADIAADFLELFPIAAFILVSSIPSEALAFTEYVEISQRPLQFIRDPSLVDSAIVGIEAFPDRTSTAGQLLSSPVSHIPIAPVRFAPGMGVRVMATAYSSSPDETDSNPFITASGSHVHVGTLATNFLPFGTRVRIGNITYTVEDRMNSRYNGLYIVDVWYPSKGEAINFGVRVLEMEIVSVP